MRGGSGGGRSSGGRSGSSGGGRSSGSRSGSGRSSAGSSLGRSGGSSLGRSSGSSSSSRGSGNTIVNVNVGRSRGHSHGGWGHGNRNRGRRYYGRGYGRAGGGGTLAVIILVIIFIWLLWPSDAGVTRSTENRTPLERGVAVDSGPLFHDHIDAIRNNTQLETGLKNFFKETGVRPHLYILGEIDGNDALPNTSQLGAFANDKYEELFNDEGHLLLVFFYSERLDSYTMYTLPGNAARSVIDQEAQDILMDYIERYYSYTHLTNAELFSRAFDEAGKRIMTVTKSPWIPVLTVFGVGTAVIIILLILISFWKKKVAQKNLEAEQTAAILGQDLSTFGDSANNDEASKLAQQYENPDKN